MRYVLLVLAVAIVVWVWKLGYESGFSYGVEHGLEQCEQP